MLQNRCHRCQLLSCSWCFCIRALFPKKNTKVIVNAINNRKGIRQFDMCHFLYGVICNIYQTCYSEQDINLDFWLFNSYSLYSSLLYVVLYLIKQICSPSFVYLLYMNQFYHFISNMVHKNVFVQFLVSFVIKLRTTFYTDFA